MPPRPKTIQQLATKICKKQGVRYSKDETEKLLKLYRFRLEKSEKDTGKMDRSHFRELLHECFDITDDLILDRVFRGFDQDNDGFISMEEWVKGLSVYIRGGMEDCIKFCFNAYDLNADGHISREEMYQLLKNCLVKGNTEEEPEEMIKELIELTLKKMDIDQDGRISLEDYRQSIMADTLLLEVLGQCLPTDPSKLCFMCYVLNCEYEEKSLLNEQIHHTQTIQQKSIC